jgi:hypothetical protein
MLKIPYYVTTKGEAGKTGGGQYRFYPALLPRRKATEEDVMTHMEREYNVRRSTVKQVIIALQGTIVDMLETHNHIDLGELGFVRLEIKCSGEDDPTKVTRHHIKKPTLHIRLSGTMKQALKYFRFEKATASELKNAGVANAKKK